MVEYKILWLGGGSVEKVLFSHYRDSVLDGNVLEMDSDDDGLWWWLLNNVDVLKSMDLYT